MKQFLSLIFLLLTASVIQFMLLSTSGCAYKLSSRSQLLPGNVKRIQIPLFKNKSVEPGVEVFFTNALKTEALKSSVVSIQDKENQSEGILQGTIQSIDVVAEESVIQAKDTKFLPSETVIATQYKVNATIELVLKRKGSTEILWSGIFKQGSNYTAPQITLPVINTANSLYNHSAKRQTLDALSKEMMQAAFDRMLENF
ncbi:MAG: hypothetical protein H7061_11590 [Bdellovibrionaceae bacterium]|nr:hypothetical protein [Bdellovibrio sp.]